MRVVKFFGRSIVTIIFVGFLIVIASVNTQTTPIHFGTIFKTTDVALGLVIAASTGVGFLWGAFMFWLYKS